MASNGIASRDTALQMAGIALGRGDLAGAERLLRRLVESRPRFAEAWNLLSIAANGRGRTDDAIEAASTALRLDASRGEFHLNHGRALKSAARLDEAVAAYEQAVRLAPRQADAYVSLGIALRRLGRLDEAVARYREALRLRPDFPEALVNLGNALAERIGQGVGDNLTSEDLREAEQVQRRALALAPGDPDALHNLAIVLKLTGRYEEAADLFNRALGIDATRVETCLQFGALLSDEARLDLARLLYTQWLRGNAADARVMLALADCLADIGEADEALGWLARVDEIEAGSAAARHLRGRIEQRAAPTGLDAARALETFRAAIDARPDYFEAVCSYLLTSCYSQTDPAELLREHRRRIAPVLQAIGSRASPRAGRRAPGRLRVGYVSHDFKRHSVAYFMEGVLESRDRARHEVFAYKTNAGGDEVTARMRASCDHWIEAGALSDAQLAQRCRADGIDVLVDLSGLTSGARLGVFARRAAPCQLTYLGYPATTGADCFDFRLTDDVVDPAGHEAFSSEPLLRLPGGMFCYRPGTSPPVSALPALARGEVTFGSFNNVAKIGEPTLRLWCAVLQAVPASRLLLKAAAFLQRGHRDAVSRLFEARGIDAARLAFQPFAPDPQAHLAAYGDIDVALDTFPFNGATTTCEALHMGVPVVTLPGATAPSRMGAAILRAAGLAHWIAADEADYVRIATRLAADLPALAALRAGQREALSRSRLMDRTAFTRDFEAAIDFAFDACEQRPTTAS